MQQLAETALRRKQLGSNFRTVYSGKVSKPDLESSGWSPRWKVCEAEDVPPRPLSFLQMSTTLSLFAQPTVIVALLCVWMLLLCLGFFAHLHFVLIVIFSTVVSEELRTVPLHMVEMTVKPHDLTCLKQGTRDETSRKYRKRKYINTWKKHTHQIQTKQTKKQHKIFKLTKPESTLT